MNSTIHHTQQAHFQQAHAANRLSAAGMVDIGETARRLPVPDAMRVAPRWLVWRAETDNRTGRPRKVPFYCDGHRRQGTLDTPEDQARLATLEHAVAALASGDYTGLGFALGPDGSGQVWQGIDFDHLPDHPDLAALVETLPGYRETSPSGQGVHAIGYGRPFDSLG